MITVADALQIISERTAPLGAEQTALACAFRRVLAEDIHATCDLPPFDRAQMDGYAVRADDAADAPVRLKIVGESAAGAGWHHDLNPGEAVRIMTGAPVPTGADSVQKAEVTREDDGYVVIEEPTTSGQFISPRASEIQKGSRLLAAGETITPSVMAVLASFGYSGVKVGRRPRVAILATGSELVPVEKEPTGDQIRDSNSYSIGSYAELAGAEVNRLPLAGDDQYLLERVISRAAADNDMLILSGGVSMGVYDYTKAALRSLGAEIFFERVALRPGKPTVFARLGEAIVFGLPGNPVSVSVTFNLFARTAIRAVQGDAEPVLRHESAVLTTPARGSQERESYLPARLEAAKDGRLGAAVLRWAGSSDLVAFAFGDALVNVPAGQTMLEAESVVRAVRLPA